MTGAIVKKTISGLASLVLLAGCSSFAQLQQELTETRKLFHTVSGVITAPHLPSDPVVIAFIDAPPSQRVRGVWVLDSPAAFDLVVEHSPFRIVAFSDRNYDFRYQPDEPFGWYGGGKTITPETDPTNRLSIVLHTPEPADERAPLFLASFEERDVNTIGGISFHHGSVTPLSSPFFDRTLSEKGQWEPLSYLRQGGVGVHFLQPYDPDKIPVIFVHGVNGTPRDFSYLIERLDRNRYQPWVFNYPSSFSLKGIGDALLESLSLIHHSRQFEKLYLVAHSVGGLVSRYTLNDCVERGGCDYIDGFITLSTPWGGHTSAGIATRWSPVLAPVWTDITPGSPFLTTLLAQPLPIPHALLFSYHRQRVIGAVNSDGVVSLQSELVPSVQEQAVMVRGINETHTGILRSEETSAILNRLLEKGFGPLRRP